MDELILTQDEIKKIAHDFMQEYFAEVEEIVGFHVEFINENGFIEPSVDYSSLRVFLDTAANDLKSLDPGIFNSLLIKLHSDVASLHNYFTKLTKNLQISKVVYVRDFLENIKLFVDLQDDMKKTDGQKGKYKSLMLQAENQLEAMKEIKTKEDLAKQKNLKRRYADALHKYSECEEELKVIRKKLKYLEEVFQEEFFEQFEQYRDYYLSVLKRVVNVKAYYFDKLLWYNAKDSEIIRKFFKDSKIEGDYETKTFVKYYIRNLNIDQTKEHSWHAYLTEVLRMLD